MQPMPQPAPAPGGPAVSPPMGSAVAHQITHGPSFAMLAVDLVPGQILVAEAGAMVARNQHVQMAVKLNASPAAGFIATLKALVIAFIRKFIGGETFIVNHFTAPSPGRVWLAPAMSGHVAHRRMNGEKLILSTGAYLAHVGNLDINVKFGGLKGILAKEGAFWLEVSGVGELWFTSYGGIETLEIHEPFMIDNGHVVGYEGNLNMNIKRPGGGMMGLVASGEGLVCEFTGQGRVYIQSRNLGSLVSWLSPLLP